MQYLCLSSRCDIVREMVISQTRLRALLINTLEAPLAVALAAEHPFGQKIDKHPQFWGRLPS